ncbi:MAG TPA: hypothetical protein VFP54_07230 [Acidimicrobiales bacterium]|nr:hypothetical protein [Acidimicrobiales bacterium]
MAAAAVIVAAGAMAFTPMAWAATSGTGTTTVTIGAGGLSVSSVGNSTMSVNIGQAGTGMLGTADWADATGTGNGWNGTVAVSSLVDNGSWAAVSGTDALGSTGAGTYTGTADGIWYKVAVTSAVTGTSVSYSYTSNYTGDTSGTGSATASGGSLVGSVGNEGVTITFSSTGSYSSSDAYVVHVGAQTSLMAFSATGGATITSVNTTSPAPLYYAASTGQNITTTGLKVLDALPLTGSSGTGYYTAAPGVTFTPDSNSWAASYSGTVTYSIISGP